MKKRGLRYLVLFLVLAVCLSLSSAIPSHAEEASPDLTGPLVNVLITYYQRPDTGDISQIQTLTGTVKTAYTVVPTIAASLPAGAVTVLRANPKVKMVEDDIVFRNCLLSQTLPWGVDRIDAELAHPTNKGTGVKVAVLDTGIDLDHPDLSVAGNVTFVPGTQNGDDDHGHGTSVAGIIAALDNDIGVVGVAPEVSLYSVKVLDSYGDAYMSVVLSGIDWCTTNNMQVMNMSFGGLGDMPQAVRDAIVAAYNAGIVLVAGAGNGGNPEGTGENIYTPARYDSVIAAGATDENDVRCPTSSTGADLEVMAPGNNIYTTTMGGGYGYASTTSTASPHVSGTAALLIASGISSNVVVRGKLRDSATDLGDAGWDSKYGYGLINAWDALNLDQTPPVITITQPLDGAHYPIGMTVVADYTATDAESGIQSITGTVPDGNNIDTATAGTKTFTVTATDNANNEANKSVSYEVYDTLTLYASADSYLRGGSKNVNEGDNPALSVHKSGPNRTVVAFDLTGVSTSLVTGAELIFTISEPPSSWGTTGRTIDAHRLLTQWVEGNGVSGAGVTWNCPIDPNISNSSTDGASQWGGGNYAAATAPSVLITNNLTGEVSFDVTADVQAGAGFGWLIRKTNETQNGQVDFYSKESAGAKPKLILHFGS